VREREREKRDTERDKEIQRDTEREKRVRERRK
jgi:hypothetical protein